MQEARGSREAAVNNAVLLLLAVVELGDFVHFCPQFHVTISPTSLPLKGNYAGYGEAEEARQGITTVNCLRFTSFSPVSRDVVYNGLPPGLSWAWRVRIPFLH